MKVRDKWEILHRASSKIVPDLDEMHRTIVKMTLQTAKQNSFIHGDLGIWNMLWMGGTIKIYDFGEVRLGDYHFDIAAAITSSIRENSSEYETREAVINFIKGYEKYGRKIDVNKLLINIQLWYLRGMLAMLDINKEVYNISPKSYDTYSQAITKYKNVFSNFTQLQ
ncbi:phosphotransferase [Bacillus sp. CGMCC 1.16607]|uniref:phosphotransferase n=1 Tax=Bacillus sp. CGMCC 1.16607 TaxID=3351842 RepID=UPI003637078F